MDEKTREILEFVRDGFPAVAFATVEENGNPRNRYAIIQDVSENGLIFQTTKDKRFYENLQHHPVVSVAGLNDKPEAVMITGKVRELGEEGLDKLIEAKPELADQYKDEEARQNAAIFEIYDGEGQHLDLAAGSQQEIKF